MFLHIFLKSHNASLSMEVLEDTINTLINAEGVKQDMIYVPQQTLKFD